MARRRATNPPARLNRSLLALAGVVLLAGAALVLGIATERLSLAPASAPLLPAGTTLPSWGVWGAAVAGVVVGLAGLGWLAAQARRRPTGVPWTAPAGEAAGVTTVPSRVLESAVHDDLTSHPGIVGADSRLVTAGPVPTVFVEIDLDAHAGPAEARAHLELQVLPRLRRALDVTALPAELLLRTGRAPAGRRLDRGRQRPLHR